tara:strand:+ start:1858 stop:2523 length:666 start_codon:yes stop_codon:yes gene_type:complete
MNCEGEKMYMYKMQLDKMSDTALDKMAGVFDDLPTTSHADGKYRLRRYSRVQMSPETMVYETLDGNKFTQSSKYNNFQGDVARSFESISDDTIKGYAFWELCSRFINTFRFPLNNVVEVHQMRVITLDDETPVAPEGIHQDGYDGICIACVERHNVEGGHLLIHREKDSPPIANFALENGDLAYINDRVLWHDATTLSRKDSSQDGYMDLIILTATNNVIE